MLSTIQVLCLEAGRLEFISSTSTLSTGGRGWDFLAECNPDQREKIVTSKRLTFERHLHRFICLVLGLLTIRTSHHLTRQISPMPNLLLPLPEYLPLGSTPYICFFKLFKIWGCLESRIGFKSLYLCCVITINLDTVLVLHISCKIQLPNISPKIKTIKFVTVEQADWFHYVFCIMESLYQQFTIIL